MELNVSGAVVDRNETAEEAPESVDSLAEEKVKVDFIYEEKPVYDFIKRFFDIFFSNSFTRYSALSIASASLSVEDILIYIHVFLKKVAALHRQLLSKVDFVFFTSQNDSRNPMIITHQIILVSQTS